MAPQANLMEEGVYIMIKQIHQELAGDTQVQLRALRTLSGMARKNASAVPVTFVQTAFRQLGGFQQLIALLSTSMNAMAFEEPLETEGQIDTPSQRRSTFNATLECITELIWQNAANCGAAVQCGVIPVITTYVSGQQNPPPNPAALRLLYQLVVCEEHCGDIHDGFMSCLTIPALMRLLDSCLTHAGEEHQGAWAAEILGVLAPLVHKSRDAAEQLVTLGGMHSLAKLIATPLTEPLPLSLMLDIVEVLVSTGDASVQSEVRSMLTRDGLLSPILQVLQHPSLNVKAAAILTCMTKEDDIVEVMQAVISPRTLHELCRLALETSTSEDLSAAPTAALISRLLAHASLQSLRHLVLGRCLDIVLQLAPPLSNEVVALAMSPVGQAVIDNLSYEFRFDAALAAVHLFCACSDPNLLTKHARVTVLVAVAFHEVEMELPRRDALALNALGALMGHFRSLDALSPVPSGTWHTNESIMSRDLESISTFTPVMLREIRDAASSVGHDPLPLPASASGHFRTVTSFSDSVAGVLSPTKSRIGKKEPPAWKSVAEMRHQSELDCSIVTERPPRNGKHQQRKGGKWPAPGHEEQQAPPEADDGAASRALSAADSAQHRAPLPPISKVHFKSRRQPFLAKEDVNKKRYDTVTFVIDGQEFYALGWALETCCPGLRDVLNDMDDLTEPISLDTLVAMSSALMYEAFALLVEYVYTGCADIQDDMLAPVWALAASLGYEALMVLCEKKLIDARDRLLDQGDEEEPRLQQALVWAAIYDPDGELHRVCCQSACMLLEDNKMTDLILYCARYPESKRAVIAGLSLCLESVVLHAMDAGLLCSDHGSGRIPV